MIRAPGCCAATASALARDRRFTSSDTGSRTPRLSSTPGAMGLNGRPRRVSSSRRWCEVEARTRGGRDMQIPHRGAAFYGLRPQPVKSQESAKTRAWVQICFDTRRPETYHYALMPGALPLSLDLLQSARRDVSLAGRLAVADLSRLTPSLATERGEAAVELRIHLGADRRVLVEGTIEAELQLQCQRCMQPMTLNVQARTRLAWVKSEAEAAELAEQYEPLLAPDGRVTL